MTTDHLLAQEFAATHPEEVARFIERLPSDEAAEVLRVLDAEAAASVLSLTAPLMAAIALARTDAKTGGEVLEAAHPSLAANLLLGWTQRRARGSSTRCHPLMPKTCAG